MILCMLQVAGIGLNMTAARYVQFLDKLLRARTRSAGDCSGQPHRPEFSQRRLWCWNTSARTRWSLGSKPSSKGKVKTIDNIVEGAAEWKQDFLAELKREDET